jgi:peptide/nickel transport system permease protein
VTTAPVAVPAPTAPGARRRLPAVRGGAVLTLILRRLAGLVGTMLVASFVVFGALHAAPGSPISFLTQGRSVSPDAIARLKAEYHLDDPFLVQYLRWLGGVLHGDFGTSIIFGERVSSLLGDRAGNTLSLLALTTLLVLVIGLTAGLFAGLRRDWLGEGVAIVATAAMAVPGFVAAVILILVLSVQTGWFPSYGMGHAGGDRIRHLLLPALALSFASIAYVVRLTQSAIRTELGSDHVQTATARGLPRRVVVRRHVVRNAAIPVLTVAGLTVAGLIAGSVVVEQIFQLGGLGQFLVDSVQKKDFPVVQAICLVYVAGFIVINTLIDLAYTLLDPRIQLGRSSS